MFKYLSSRMPKGDSGFTLVEILIVVLVLSVLATIAIPTYFTLNERAREIATRSDMRTIATGLELYNSLQEAYPTTAEGLDILNDSDVVDPIPANDKWNMPYDYTSDGISYELRSSGMDAILSTDDDIVFSDGILTEVGNFNNLGVGD